MESGEETPQDFRNEVVRRGRAATCFEKAPISVWVSHLC